MAVFILFALDWKISSLDKLGPKNQNYQFKLKFGTSTDLNIQNSMALFTLSVLDQKHAFWANLVQKNETCQCKLNFGT